MTAQAPVAGDELDGTTGRQMPGEGPFATGRVAQINRSAGGVPKRPVAQARVNMAGLEGDAHRDTAHHGGEERALCLYSLERIWALPREGHPIFPGAVGENLTLAGLPGETVVPGVRLVIGNKELLEVTRYTTPCPTIAPYLAGGAIARIAHTHHPGWARLYARVLHPGWVRAGHSVTLLG